MIIKHRNQYVELPEIPDLLKNRYPYYWIGYQTQGEFFLVIMSLGKFFHTHLTEVSHAILSPDKGVLTRANDSEGTLYWMLVCTTEEELINAELPADDLGCSLWNNEGTGVMEFVWANHDIQEMTRSGAPRLLDGFYYLTDTDPVEKSYAVSSTWLDRLGDVVREVTGVKSRYSSDEILDVLEDVSNSEGVEF